MGIAEVNGRTSGVIASWALRQLFFREHVAQTKHFGRSSRVAVSKGFNAIVSADMIRSRHERLLTLTEPSSTELEGRRIKIQIHLEQTN